MYEQTTVAMQQLMWKFYVVALALIMIPRGYWTPDIPENWTVAAPERDAEINIVVNSFVDLRR
jgi:hypothetical protein